MQEVVFIVFELESGAFTKGWYKSVQVSLKANFVVLYGGKPGQPFGGGAKTVPARAIPNTAGQSRLVDM